MVLRMYARWSSFSLRFARLAMWKGVAPLLAHHAATGKSYRSARKLLNRASHVLNEINMHRSHALSFVYMIYMCIDTWVIANADHGRSSDMITYHQMLWMFVYIVMLQHVLYVVVICHQFNVSISWYNTVASNIKHYIVTCLYQTSRFDMIMTYYDQVLL